MVKQSKKKLIRRCLILDEVSLILDIIQTNWNASRTALNSAGKLGSTPNLPNLVDVRTLQKNRGVRYDLSAGDVIVVFEDSQNIEYPTIHYDLKNETYSFTLHLRTIHDERAVGVGSTDPDFGRDRLRDLYLITVHALETSRRGYTASDGTRFNQLFVGSRTESNDRSKRLFGYKVTLEAKRFAISIP